MFARQRESFWRPFSTSSVTMEYYYQSLGQRMQMTIWSLLNLIDMLAERFGSWGSTTYFSLGARMTALSSGKSCSHWQCCRCIDVLLSPSLSISVSDEVQLVAGGFVGLGEQPKTTSVTEVLINPDALHVNSEFGLMPGSRVLYSCEVIFLMPTSVDRRANLETVDAASRQSAYSRLEVCEWTGEAIGCL